MEAMETVASDPWGLDRRIASGVEAFLVFLEPLRGEVGGVFSSQSSWRGGEMPGGMRVKQEVLGQKGEEEDRNRGYRQRLGTGRRRRYSVGCQKRRPTEVRSPRMAGVSGENGSSAKFLSEGAMVDMGFR